MLITRIIAKNFKTYKDLDLELTAEPDKPIILIGGDNGGGKTTLFQSIYFALYGLNLKSMEDFRKFQNAGTLKELDTRIELEIHFTGQVLHSTYVYILKRQYALNAQNIPVESVSLNLNGDIFTYGSATPFNQRTKSESEVNKIIKANLPQELSKYFLFDAMESGNLLKEEYLNRVIKENIENVMGFNKYLKLSKINQSLIQDFIEEGLEIEEERKQYKLLVEQRQNTEADIELTNHNLENALHYTNVHRLEYENAKEGKDLQVSIRDRIRYLNKEKDDILSKESLYSEQVNKFLDDIEIQVFIPKLSSLIQEELLAIINEKKSNVTSNVIDKNDVELIANRVGEFLKANKLIANDLSANQKEQLVKFILNKNDNADLDTKYSLVDQNDVTFFEQLLNWSTINFYPIIEQQKNAIEKEIERIPQIEAEIIEARKKDVGGNEIIIESFELNTIKTKELKDKIILLKSDIERIDKKLKVFDISDEEIPNPKLETLKKLHIFFDTVSDELLKSKKSNIELAMKDDLNIMLGAYKNQIDKVELSENLTNLSFKIYHKAGNEIYLDQLNAAAKQIIVQVLLKSLHHYGDYNPPVMIDTVMGYLGESSRNSLLEHYFPSLSHQTILLSTDTEIRKDKDLEKIDCFISKKYTLIRDVEKQLTNVVEGYFES